MSEKPKMSGQTITIQPRYVYGLRVDIKGNVNFTNKQEVIYPVAGVLTIHDYVTEKQKFLRFTEKSNPEIITMSPNRKMLAVSERLDKITTINIYDLLTLKKRKTLNFPAEIPTPSAESISFTYDSKGIAVLSKEPDAFMIIFFFDKSESIVVGRVSNSNQKTFNARYISCNPADTGLVAVGGDFTFKLMSRQEKAFTLIGTISGENKIITSLIWLNADILLAGTADSKLLFIEGGDPKTSYCAETIDVIDLTKTKEDETTDADTNKLSQSSNSADIQLQIGKTTSHQKGVNCLTYFQNGFAYAIKNVLFVFEKQSNYRYAKKTVIRIPIVMFGGALFRIENVAVNAQMDTVIVTTRHSQIYTAALFVPESLQAIQLEFRKLGEPLHISGIVGMAVCSWKPIVMTASSDQTIRIWNYDNGTVELVKKYQVDVTVIALHPSGMFVAVGFLDQLRLMEILLDDLKVTKTFNFPKCQEAVFSHQGHMLACAYESAITIVSVFSFEIIRSLNGHNGQILSLAFSNSDEYLVSAGEEGAVYQWRILTGERMNECVQKGTEYRSLALTTDMTATYSITNTGFLREMNNSEIVRELRMPHQDIPLTSIALARSDLVMFVASELGHLYNVQIPFLDTGGGTCTNYRFFHNSITKMKISYNDMLLATGSADGTLVIWSILNNNGRIAAMDIDLGKCVDIVIPRLDLCEKISEIKSLEIRMAQQITEFQYQLSQGDAFHSEQMRDIHTGYCSAIEDLKSKNEQLEAQHIEEFNIITENIAQTKDEHAKALMDLETDFHQKIIVEYEKSAQIKKKMDDMREDYEVKLRKSAGCLQDTIAALESDFKKQLKERQELIRQLMKEMETKKSEYEECSRQVSADHDRRMVDFKIHFVQQINDLNEKMEMWRADAGVLSKKLIRVSKNCDELETEKEILRNEHDRTQKIIQNYQQDAEELRQQIEDRDLTIRDKERAVNEMGKKNQELEKYKQVLTHKITELKEQIEPREREIRERKDQLADMETELEALEKLNLNYELQLSELKDKYNGSEKELKLERARCRNSRAQISRICGDIFHVSGFVQKPLELKAEVMKLYHRYSADKTLKKSLELDAEVQTEFLRQRDHLERLLEMEKQKNKKPSTVGSNYEKLLKENIHLLAELKRSQDLLAEVQTKCQHMESVLGLSGKYLPTAEARKKLSKACANFDELERKHQQDVQKLQSIISQLQQENQTIRVELFAADDRANTPSTSSEN